MKLGNIGVVPDGALYDETDSLMNIACPSIAGERAESDVIAVTYDSLGNLARYQGRLRSGRGELPRRWPSTAACWAKPPLHRDRTAQPRGAARSRGNIPGCRTAAAGVDGGPRRVYDGPHARQGAGHRSMAEFYPNQMRLAEADSLIYGSLAMTRQLYGEQADDTNHARLGVAGFPAARRPTAAAEEPWPTCWRSRARAPDRP
ncbi:MAG: hypothetical protein IPH86_08385 [bacterium]|nr:hypothetical protein [bacterium]